MSAYTIIGGASRELRQRIFQALETAPDADFGLTSAAQDITAAAPTDELEGDPRVSVFLYHLEPDGHLRNQAPLADGAGRLRLPPFTLNLRYLVTPLDDAPELNHLMLGRILQFLHDAPVIDGLNGTPLGSSFGGAAPEMRLDVEPLSMEQLSHIWTSLNATLRLSFAVAMRVVAIDSARGETPARRVVDTHVAVGAMERASR
jgi:hypothetical protein